MLKYLVYFILLVFTISCNKENPTETTIGHDPNLFGSWTLTTAKINDEIIDSTQYGDIPVKIFFKADGSGLFIKENGSSESITWNTSGDQLRIDDEVTINYAVLGNSITLSVADTIGTTELTYAKEAEKEHDPSLVGTWILITAKINGEIIDSTQYNEIPVKILFRVDGSGSFMEESGISNSVTWYTSGNQLRIDNEVGINYTVVGSILTLIVLEGSYQIELTYLKQ